MGCGQLSSPPAPTIPPVSGKPVSTSNRKVIAAVCQPLAAKPAKLHQAFSRKFWQHKTDARGFVGLGKWRLYIEEALPKTPVQAHYWDGKLGAEYDEQILTEYDCHGDAKNLVPKSITKLHSLDHPYHSSQAPLFDPLWIRDAGTQ